MQGAAAPAATGTGLVMGRVVDGSSGKPIPGAMVGLTVQMMPQAGAGGAAGLQIPGYRPQAVTTGSDGQFVFSNLPKGTFLLVSMLPGANAFLNESSQSSTQMVTLAEGEKLNDVDVRLFRPGVVTGQVRDERGDGLEGISISLVRITSNGGKRNLSVARSTTTDDRGVFRVAGVSPGDYGVCALFSRRIAPVAAGLAQAAGNADLQRTLSGSGGNSPSGSGYRVGDFVLISGSGQRNVDPAPGEDGRFSVFADVCSPSAPTVQDMEIVRVESGQERGQMDMVLRIVPSVRISGKLVGPANRLSGMAVYLYPAIPGAVSLDGAMWASQTITDPEGGFGFIGVPQGSYVLRVAYVSPEQRDATGLVELINRLAAQGQPVPPELASMVTQRANVPAEPTLWATAPITIGESDVNGVTLALREGSRMSGAIMFDGSREKPPATQLTSASFGLESTEGQMAYAQPRGRFAADATFNIPGIVPGSYLPRPNLAFAGWTIKSIVANGRNVLDDPIDVGVSDISGVVITMTDRPTDVSGTVRTNGGQPDRRALVVVFPSDRARWSQLNAGRRMKTTTVTRQGTFSFSGLPAGEYFIAAISDQAGANWQDPRVLEILSRSATPLSLRDGDRRTVDVTTSVVR